MASGAGIEAHNISVSIYYNEHDYEKILSTYFYRCGYMPGSREGS